MNLDNLDKARVSADLFPSPCGVVVMNLIINAGKFVLDFLVSVPLRGSGDESSSSRKACSFDSSQVSVPLRGSGDESCKPSMDIIKTYYKGFRPLAG